VHPRLLIDLGWSDLGYATLATLGAGNRARRAQHVEELFSPRGDAFAALSARSGFDLYLSALALPPGSEVLVSGLTIPHMVQILEAHQLRVVPFALDPSSLAPAEGELERLATPSTRAVLFAHLFGQRAELGGLVALARRRGWLLWEDCAQAYTGDEWRGHPASDLALFSFGLIKTATAVQGGILLVREAEVRARMRTLERAWPVQRRSDYLRRVRRAALLVALSPPPIFARFARASARRGRDLDQLLHDATRGFPGPDFLARLRRRPSSPLLALLARRIAHPQASLAPRRRAFGESLLQELGGESEVLGRGAHERHHWVFALGSDEPAQLVRALRAAGFDATARSSLVPVQPSGGGEAPAASKRLLGAPGVRADRARRLRAPARRARAPAARRARARAARAGAARARLSVGVGQRPGRPERQPERHPREQERDPRQGEGQGEGRQHRDQRARGRSSRRAGAGRPARSPGTC
jgi:dTDP-4-amino-4,6-dideoxygalactose transaminase